MKSYLIPLAGFLATVSASSAAVVTLSPVSFNSTVGSASNYPTLSFAKFNSSLGTLTDVTFSFQVDSSVTSASVTNNASGSVTINKFSFTRDFTITDSTGAELFSDGVLKQTSFTPISLSNGQTKTVSNVSFSQLNDSTTVSGSQAAAYAGSGNATLTLNNSIGVTPNVTAGGQSQNWATTLLGASWGSFTVSYTYNEAPPVSPVPEPSSMIFSGLLLGSGLFVRRRKVRG